LGTTTISYEYPSNKGEAFYPLRDKDNLELLSRYTQLAQKYKNIFFAGRLGEYKYYDIDQAVSNALKMYKKIV